MTARAVAIRHSFIWRGSNLPEALLKSTFHVRQCGRRSTTPASMAVQFSSTWTKLHDFGWQEKLHILKDEWAIEGWYVASAKVVKFDSSYKVTVEYEKRSPGNDRLDHFTEEIWRSPRSTWKPCSVTVHISPGPSLEIGWWYKEPAHEVAQLDRCLRNDLHIDEASSVSAMASGVVEMAAAPAAPPEDVVLSDTEESSSSLEGIASWLKTEEAARPP